MKHIEYLKSIDAPKEMLDFALTCRTFRDFWNTCKRADWMVHILAAQAKDVGGASSRKLIQVLCWCAQLVVPKYIGWQDGGVSKNYMGIVAGFEYARGEIDEEDAQIVKAQLFEDVADIDTKSMMLGRILDSITSPMLAVKVISECAEIAYAETIISGKVEKAASEFRDRVLSACLSTINTFIQEVPFPKEWRDEPSDEG